MFYKQEQFIDHNKKFYNAFIDLKVDGWNAFSNAFDAYTHGFFKAGLSEMNKQVNKLADAMKV